LSSDVAIGYEHAIVGQLRERGWPVAVPVPSGAGRLVVADEGRRKLAEVRTAAGSAASGPPGVQLVHGDWHDGNILYQEGAVSGTRTPTTG
jgi:Ser/Thr protein kinase RdoA (MazF antagonist)